MRKEEEEKKGKEEGEVKKCYTDIFRVFFFFGHIFAGADGRAPVYIF